MTAEPNLRPVPGVVDGRRATAHLKALEPQLIGAGFRSSAPVDSASVRLAPRSLSELRDLYGWLTAKTRFLLIGLGFGVTLLGLAGAADVLGAPVDGTRRSALDHLFSDSAGPTGVSLSLLQDPAGLIVLAVVLVTPVFCCQQVQAIADFVRMNEDNGARLTSERAEQHDELVDRTNKAFARLGGAGVSVVLLLAAAACAGSLYAFVHTNGLMANWNPTPLPDAVWRSEVYDGWWANWHRHPELALALCAAGTYAFYFLSKQLMMGVVFTQYLYRSWELGFGVTPNMEYDSDGYRGLRPLRRFMLWTYGSSLAHLTGLLVLFTVWLPAEAWMVFIVLAVMLVDMLVIVYPSSIGYHSALKVKQDHVKALYESALASEERDAAIAQVWSAPVLPVTTRKAATGIFLYLLAPAIPALIPVLFQRL
ncbi:hypothetical protein AB0I00_04970 [Streptomyces sp. NPDC050803]|uniref:hypothetical protein n=1 Tax=unclassified Streptomyces TaxID=2593676 RepID=UPI003447D45B